MRVRASLMRRAFCSAKPPSQSGAKLSEQAQQSQRMWDMLVPERNIGVTHPMFIILAGLTIGLHFYNNHQDEKLEAELKAKRLAKESRE